MRNIFNKRRRERREFENKVAFTLESIGHRIGNLELVNTLLWGSREQSDWIGRMAALRTHFQTLGTTQDEVNNINTLTVSTAIAVADAKRFAHDAATNTVEMHERLQEIFDKLVVMGKRTSSAPVWDPLGHIATILNIVRDISGSVINIETNTGATPERLQNIVARLDAICTRLDNLAKPNNFAEKVLEAIKRAHQSNCAKWADIEEAVRDHNNTFVRVVNHNDRLVGERIKQIDKFFNGNSEESKAENKRLRQQVAVLKGQVTRLKNRERKNAYNHEPKIGFPKA